MNYERLQGRKHPEWEKRIKSMLDMFLRLQNKDGSFPRKFKDDFSIVDKSGGSTPSATLPLVMGYKYFKDKRYLASAKHTVEYLEKELISKSDYFLLLWMLIARIKRHLCMRQLPLTIWL